MNYKMIAMKLFMSLMLAGGVFGNAAYAESRNTGQGKCSFKPDEKRGTCSGMLRCGGFLAGDVNVMGDLKMKIIKDVNERMNRDQQFTIVEVKAPGYHERLTLMITSSLDVTNATTQRICGKDVSFWLTSPSDLRVLLDDF